MAELVVSLFVTISAVVSAADRLATTAPAPSVGFSIERQIAEAVESAGVESAGEAITAGAAIHVTVDGR